MSGSGVVVPGGAVAGIASVDMKQAYQLVLYNPQDEPVSTLPYTSDYFMFTPLNQKNIDFILSTLSAFPDRERPEMKSLGNKYSEEIGSALEDVFDEFSSEKTIQDTPISL